MNCDVRGYPKRPLARVSTTRQLFNPATKRGGGRNLHHLPNAMRGCRNFNYRFDVAVSLATFFFDRNQRIASFEPRQLIGAQRFGTRRLNR